MRETILLAYIEHLLREAVVLGRVQIDMPTSLSPPERAGCYPIQTLAHQLLQSYIEALCDNNHGHAETSAILAANMVG